MRKLNFRSLLWGSAFCILNSAFLLTSGCNALGALAFKTVGPAKIPAEYTPPQEPMLVLVENYGHASDLQPAADQLANLLSDELKTHKVAPIVDPSPLLALRSEKPGEFEKMKIPEVGRIVGARQVMYVDLEECDVHGVPGADVVQGKIAAKVRVVDVATGVTRWPDTGESRPLRASTDYVRHNGADASVALRSQMLGDLAGQISRLFYAAQPDFENGKGEPD